MRFQACRILLLTASLPAAPGFLHAGGQNELVPPGGPPPLATPPPPETGAEKFPARPVTGLLDDGNVFTPEQRIQMESDLEDFRSRSGIRLTIVTTPYVDGDSLEVWSRRLHDAWMKDAPGLLVVYERGSSGLSFQGSRGLMNREEEMRQLFRMGDRAGKSQPREATPAQRLQALIRTMTTAAGAWRETGKLPDPGTPEAPPPPDTPAVPGTGKAPVDFVRDGGNLFSEDEEVALKSALIHFHSRWDFDVYVATATFLPEQSVSQWAVTLTEKWASGRRAIVIAYNRGTARSGEASASLHATPEAEAFLGVASLQKLAIPPAAAVAPEEFTPLIHRTLGIVAERAAAVSHAHTSAGGEPPRLLMGLAAALVAGSGLLYLFHRIQERLESRSSEQFLFPDVNVSPRLGAAEGGGIVAGGPFRKTS